MAVLRDLPDLRATTVHELGHNLSLGHAGAGCPPGRTDCVELEYGDCHSPMGAGSEQVISTAHRAMLSILQRGELLTLDGAHGPVEQAVGLSPRGATTGTRGLAVTDPETGATWYVDYRSNSGLDERDDGDSCAPGVTVTRLGPKRSTILTVRGINDALQTREVAWQPGDVIHLGRHIRLGVTSATPEAGARLLVDVASPPPFRRVGTAVIPARPRLGGLLSVRTTGFKPTPTRTTVRWLLDGEVLRDAAGDPVTDKHPRFTWITGGRLVAEVTAYRDGRRRAIVRSVAMALPRATHLPSPVIEGTPVVGEHFTAAFILRPQAFRHKTVRYRWLLDGKPVAEHSRNWLLLTSDMIGRKLRVKVIVTGPGTEKLVRTSRMSKPVRAAAPAVG